MRLPASPTMKAPNDSDVRVLLSTSRGSCAYFELAGGQTSTAVVHSTVEQMAVAVMMPSCRARRKPVSSTAGESPPLADG
jgi:hypothetical protein